MADLPHVPDLCEVRGECGTQGRPGAQGQGIPGHDVRQGQELSVWLVQNICDYVIKGGSTLVINQVQVIFVYMSRLC